MSRNARRNGLGLIWAASLILGVVPACTAFDGLGAPSPQVAGTLPDGRIAYRPVFPYRRNRPLYLSGYAGHTYGPDAPARELNPTIYRPRGGRWFGWCFGGR